MIMLSEPCIDLSSALRGVIEQMTGEPVEIVAELKSHGFRNVAQGTVHGIREEPPVREG